MLRNIENVHWSCPCLLPDIHSFNNAYHLQQLLTITSKTWEMAFQILNRIIWTHNKAFKSWIRLDPNCERSGHRETMEHLLWECEYYSELLWLRLGDVLTQHLNTGAADLVPRVELQQTNIIIDIPLQLMLLHIHYNTAHNTFNTGNQERHHIQMEESVSLGTTSNSHPTTCSSSRHYHTEAMLISTINWSHQILQGYRDSVATSRNQSCLMSSCQRNPYFWPHFISWQKHSFPLLTLYPHCITF
jgi:hypothetical protein